MIGNRIRATRENFSLNQTEFAARIRISRSALAKLEKGINNPSDQTIALICREFNVSYEWLTEGIEPMLVPAESLGMAALERIMSGKNEYVKAIFRELADMPDEWWEQAIAMLKRIEGKEKDR